MRVGALGLGEALAAGAGRAGGVDPEVVGREGGDGMLLLQVGQDIDQGERGVAAVVLVEGRDPDQAVDAVLGAKQAEGPRTLDQQRHSLEAGLVARRQVENLALEAMVLRPVGVHPHQHLGPILGVDPAGAGADRDQRVVRGVGVGEEQLELLGLELARDLVRLPGQLERQLGVFQRGQLEEVEGLRLELLPLAALGAEGGRLLGIAPSLVGIIPNPRLGEQLL